MSEAEESAVVQPLVKELGKTKKPTAGELYYGSNLEFGLREVKVRRVRLAQGGVEKYEDFLVFCEKVMNINGEMCKVAYYVSPPPAEPYSEYYFPVAQWNISQSHLDDQDCVPDWQLRVVLDDNGSPVYVGGRPFRAFHYLIVNRRFVPEVQPDGSDNDGLFVPHEPISGETIIRREQAKRELGGDLLGSTRRRVGGQVVTVQ